MMKRMIVRKNIGAIGIGTMIVFIAMVLVAGIAASILVQMANKVETQAMKTGEETMGEIAGGIEVIGVEGKVNYTGGNYYDMKYLAVVVGLRPGSKEIDLNQTYILLSDGVNQTLLRYGGYNTDYAPYNSSVDSSGNLFGTGTWETNYSNEYFGIIVLRDKDGSCKQANPVINKDDKVVLTICCGPNAALGREIPESTEIVGNIVPEKGIPGVISFVTPNVYNKIIYELQ